MKRRIFKSNKLQKEFEENGFCVVNMLSAEDIKELERIYYDHKVDEQTGTEFTATNKNPAQNQKINDMVGALMMKKVREYLVNYRMLYAGFITKTPDTSNEISAHQDPSFTDENEFCGLNIWSPLVDVDENNGALWIIKKSNRFFSGFRGHEAKSYSYANIQQEIIKRFGVLERMKAGQVVISDVRTFHYSLQNRSGKIRIACTTILAPEEAPAFYHHYNRDKNTVDVYEVTNNFMLRMYNEYALSGRIAERLISSSPYIQPRELTIEEFEEKYNEYNPEPQKSFLSNIFNWSKSFTRAEHP